MILNVNKFSDPIAHILGNWAIELNIYSIIFRLIVVILTAIIGWERASKRHSAGLRTFILISFSSCICMILDLYFIEEYHLTLPLL